MTTDAPRFQGRDETVAALRGAGARFAFVHGSRVHGTARAGSDVDVAAWWGTPSLPAPWDVRLPAGVDLLVLDDAPLELAGRVAATGLILFDDDPPARVEWQATTRLVYFDEQWRQRWITDTFVEAHAVVDERRVVRLLQRVTNELSYLQARAGEDRGQLQANAERLSGLKYRFVTTIEGLINVAQHFCASEGWGPPADNGDAVRLLGEHGVIRKELADQLVAAVGFRNLLVHQYADVDDSRVVGFLDRIGDIAGFVAEASAWLAVQSGSTGQNPST